MGAKKKPTKAAKSSGPAGAAAAAAVPATQQAHGAPATPQQMWVAVAETQLAATPNTRAPLWVFEKLGCGLGAWCVLFTGERVIYSRLWPFETGLLAPWQGPHGGAPECVVAGNIWRPATERERAQLERRPAASAGWASVALVRTMPAKLPRARRVAVRVAATGDAAPDAAQAGRIAALRLSPARIARIVAGLVLGRGCIVDDVFFGGDAVIEVVDVESEEGQTDRDVIVHRGTVVEIVAENREPAVDADTAAVPNADVDADIAVVADAEADADANAGLHEPNQDDTQDASPDTADQDVDAMASQLSSLDLEPQNLPANDTQPEPDDPADENQGQDEQHQQDQQDQQDQQLDSDRVFESLMQLVVYPLKYARTLSKLNIQVPKAVLLSGPPGVGKTSVVVRVARACNAKLFVVQGHDVFGPFLGESEERLRRYFAEANAAVEADPEAPVILFIDEIDAIAPRRDESSRESSLVAQLLTLMDGMAPRSRVVVLAATNRPNAIDPAVRRPGRFDREITMDVPSEGARLAMLKALAFGRGGGRGDNGADNQDDKDDSHDSGSSDQQSVLAADVDLTRVARATNGFVAADLAALWRETATAAAIDVGTTGAIEQRHFEAALARVGGPALTRGYARPLDAAGTAWNDIGGLEPVKLALRQAVEWPLVHRATFARLGLRPCRGVLLYGPPGCSKTSLVRAVAATANAAFFSISGAAVYSAYVGESERIVRSLFQRARAASPSVVFIDEIDTIVGKRALGGGGGGGGGDTVQERILSALLNEMDGIESARDVLVLAATNRPDMIDAALMRPGRFDRVIYVPPPDAAARLAILEIRTRGMPLEQGGVDLAAIAARCDMFTGADLGAVCREAATAALRAGDRAVRQAHFEAALEHIVPTLSAEMLAQYQAFAERF